MVMEHRFVKQDIVPAEIRAQMESGAKALEVASTDVMNAIEAEGQYRHERFSDRRDCWLMVRREK